MGIPITYLPSRADSSGAKEQILVQDLRDKEESPLGAAGELWVNPAQHEIHH